MAVTDAGLIEAKNYGAPADIAPSITSTPSPSFTEGTADTYDMTQHVSDDGFSAVTYSLSNTLPNGLSFNASTGILDYDGIGTATTSQHQLTAADAVGQDTSLTFDVSVVAVISASWAERSTGPSVTFASDFSGANDFVLSTTNGGHVFYSEPGEIGNVVKDVTDGLSGGCCLRIDTPTSEGQNGAAWTAPLDSSWTTNSQSFGSAPFWIQFRFKIPASRLVSTLGDQAGWKFMNVAAYSPTNTDSQSFSNTLAEHVLQDTFQRGMPQAYHRDTAGSFPPFEESGLDQTNPTEFSRQNAIDLGAPLTGGDRWCLGSGGGACEMWSTDEWMTFMVRIKPNTYEGTAGNEFDLWYARAGVYTWTHLITASDYDIGDPDSNGGGFTGINGLHLLNYETSRTGGTVDTHVKYDQVIVSTAEIAIPSDSGVGAGSGVIQLAAQGMSAGDWTLLSAATNQSSAMKQGSFWLTSQSNDCGYDPVRGRAHYAGKAQGTSPHKHIYYEDADHEWIEGVNVTGDSGGHGYDHNAVDPVTGDVYYRMYNDNFAWKAEGSDLSSFSALSDWPNTGGFIQVAVAATFWSGSFTGLTEGGLMIYNCGQDEIHIYDPVTDSWETSIESIGGASTLHSVMSYSPIHNVAIFGGGNSDARKIWRLNSDRSYTVMPDAPFDIGVYTTNGAYVVNDPISGHFVAISMSSNEIYELDPTGSGSWTDFTSAATPPANVTDGNRGTICWADSNAGVIVYAGVNSSGNDPSMYIYKHS